MADITYPRPLNMLNGGIWALIGGGVPFAASQAVPAGDGLAVLIALISTGGAIAAAWVASRRRNGRNISDDEIIISRHEYERLLELERHHRGR